MTVIMAAGVGRGVFTTITVTKAMRYSHAKEKTSSIHNSLNQPTCLRRGEGGREGGRTLRF